MNLQAQTLERVQLILKTDRPGLLDRVSQLLKQEEETDCWEELPASVQQSIEKGNREANKGETLSHNEGDERSSLKIWFVSNHPAMLYYRKKRYRKQQT